MDLGQEIAKKVNRLPPDLQERVLGFVTSISPSPQAGESGSALRRFAASLDSVSAQEMMQAIEDDCEHISGDW